MLHLIADEFGNVYWWIDASFALHPDYKSHTVVIMSMGKGGVSSLSTKQKVNTHSSTEAELVGIDGIGQTFMDNSLLRGAGVLCQHGNCLL